MTCAKTTHKNIGRSAHIILCPKTNSLRFFLGSRRGGVPPLDWGGCLPPLLRPMQKQERLSAPCAWG